jgi:hypothetical protein
VKRIGSGLQVGSPRNLYDVYATALLLAVGEDTCRLAECFRLSRWRISQQPCELADSWFQFHGLDPQGREEESVAAAGWYTTINPLACVKDVCGSFVAVRNPQRSKGPDTAQLTNARNGL